MKKLILLFTIVFLTSGICSCRTKKSTTDFKQTEIENVSITDNSTVAKTETVQENKQETKTESVTDKSFFEAWMSFESDKITITDNQGNKTEITNPRINKKSSQSNEIDKSDVVVAKNETTTTNEENQQSNINANLSKETETNLKKTDERQTKIVWLYVIIGAVIVLCVVIFLNKIFKKSN